MTYLVIDVGGTFTKYALMDGRGKFLEKAKFPTVKTSPAAFLASICQLHSTFSDVKGIALSSAGIIDSHLGLMYTGGSLDFIENLAIADILGERCHIPVTIENDAKCAALAELWQGSLADCQNAVAMIIGTAVGGAVIVDRKVLKGKDLLAGEFSYILTDSSDSLNWRKNFAINGGLPALIEAVADQKNLSLDQVSGELIFDWAKAGDRETLRSLRDYCHLLASQLVNLHFIVNPDRFAIGGGVSEQSLFIRLIQEEIDKLIASYPFPVAKPEVVSCQFHNDANLLGALYVHLEAGKV